MSTRHLEQILKFTAADGADAFVEGFLFAPHGVDVWPPVSLGYHRGDGPKDPRLYCNREIYFGQPFRLSAAQRAEVAPLREEIGRLVSLGYGLEGDRVGAHLVQAAAQGGIAAEIQSLVQGGGHSFEPVDEQAFLDGLRRHVEPTLPIILESKELSAEGSYAGDAALVDCDAVEKVELIDPHRGRLVRVERLITNLRCFVGEAGNWVWNGAGFDDLGCDYRDRILTSAAVVELDYVMRSGAPRIREIAVDGATVAESADFADLERILAEVFARA